MAAIILGSDDIAAELAARVRSRRLDHGYTLEGFASRSGVSLGTLKRFERTGKISLTSFIRLVVALKGEADLANLLKQARFSTIEDVLDQPKSRQRGRIR